MSIHKATNSYSNWNPNLDAEDLEDYIDPADKEEITKSIHAIFEIVSSAKKVRKNSYSFDPKKLNKEKEIKKTKKELQRLKTQSSALARENNVNLNRTIRRNSRSSKKLGKTRRLTRLSARYTRSQQRSKRNT